MDAVVQFIRNGLCCIKDLEWFQDNTTLSWIWDANVLPHDAMGVPEPFNETTPLDALIGITQFYAFYSMATSGFSLLHTSYGKWKRIQRLIQENHQKTAKSTDKDEKNDDAHAAHLIDASLAKEAKYALRSAFIGFLVMSIGIAFFWLFANSFKVTHTNLLGGVPGLIHALTVTEVGLLPLLVYMWMDSTEQLNKAKRIEALADRIEQQLEEQEKASGKKKDDDDNATTSKPVLHKADIDLASLEVLTGFLPFWDAGVSAFSTQQSIFDDTVEEKLVLEEKAKIQQSLKELTSPPKSKENEKSPTTVTFLQSKARELRSASLVTRWEGWREFLYFILNTIAFYSYSLCVLVWYFDDELSKPHHIRFMMFHLDNELADWHGNFWGDLMWTIEPLIILGTPSLFLFMKQQAEQQQPPKRSIASKDKAE